MQEDDHMPLKKQIDSIIEKRKAKGQVLQEHKDNFIAIRDIVRKDFANLDALTKEISDDNLRGQYAARLRAIDRGSVMRQIDAAVKKLDEGIKRFNREYISIATVGKERQGKSRFLQSVGDVDSRIIPAYDATSCTGATSIIWNSPEMEKGTVRATIYFRQPADVVSIVESYISEIDPEYLKEKPLSIENIDDIEYIFYNHTFVLTEGDAKQAAAYKHLNNIVEHFKEFKELFGASPLTLTDPELIKTYVAQNNGKEQSDPEVEYYYKYLAVDRADIHCPFFTDVGKIRLVDTIGIGDTKFGIEEAMLNTVDKECDAAIVVTKPISETQTEDQKLYTLLFDKFRHRDTRLWLFYLSNHHVGHNDNTVKAFANDVRKQKWAIADCNAVDVSSPEAVRDKFMLPMLSTLIGNMDAIDAGFLKEVEEVEASAKRAIKVLTDSLPELQSVNIGTLQGQQALQKGEECFRRMTAALRKQVFKWESEKERYNGTLCNEAQRILSTLDDIIPGAEEIQELAENTGAQTGEAVWETVLHYVRNEITNRFIQIDDLLEKDTFEFKNSLVDVLYGELRALSPTDVTSEENLDKVEWLKSMMDGVFSDDPMYTQICKAFDFLYKFQFNTRAQLIQEVRRQLYIINPICREYAKPSYNFHPANCGEPIRFYLTSRMAVIEDELRFHLNKLYRTPNMAFYAAAEEFYDRIAFASYRSGGQLVSMSAVWSNFFVKYSTKIWQQDIERYTAVNKLVDEYNKVKSALLALAEPQTM